MQRTRAFLLLAAILPLAAPVAARAQNGPLPTPAGGTASTDNPTPESSMGWTEQFELQGQELWNLFQRGGWCMWPILACSIVALAFGIERMLVLRGWRVTPRRFVTRFIKQLRDRSINKHQALDLCRENGSPIADVFGHGVRKWGRPSIEVEQAIIEGGERVIDNLRKNIRIQNAVATITPMIGLLGTIIGMMTAVDAVAGTIGLNKPELLARGIAQAFLTTAFGLIVAIPSLALFYYLNGRVEKLVREMDDHAQQIVELISIDGDESEPIPLRTTEDPIAAPSTARAAQ